MWGTWSIFSTVVEVEIPWVILRTLPSHPEFSYPLCGVHASHWTTSQFPHRCRQTSLSVYVCSGADEWAQCCTPRLWTPLSPLPLPLNQHRVGSTCCPGPYWGSVSYRALPSCWRLVTYWLASLVVTAWVRCAWHVLRRWVCDLTSILHHTWFCHFNISPLPSSDYDVINQVDANFCCVDASRTSFCSWEGESLCRRSADHSQHKSLTVYNRCCHSRCQFCFSKWLPPMSHSLTQLWRWSRQEQRACLL